MLWGNKTVAEQALSKYRLVIEKIREAVMEIARLWSAINAQAERIEELEARVSLLDDTVDGDERGVPSVDELSDEDEDNTSCEFTPDEDFLECFDEVIPAEAVVEGDSPPLKRSLRRPGAVEGSGE